MRYRSVGWIMLSALIGAYPLTAHADYFSAAKSALKKGDLKAAQIELRNAVRGDPQNGEVHYWLGRVSLELGDPVAAEREAVAARERAYDPHQAIPLLAQALLAQGKFQQVLDSLQSDGKDKALDASILVFRGYAQINLKRPEDAQRSFAAAEAAAPDSATPLLADAQLAMARGDLAAGREKIDRAIAAQPKSSEALLAKAQLLRLQNDIVGAIVVLDGLLADQPSVMKARLERASLELSAGRNDAAKADIETVLKGTPGNIQAIFLRSVMQAQSHDYKAADADLERISGFIGRIPRAYYLQALVKEQLGQLEQAEDAARKYLARSPNDLTAYKVLARIQFAKRRPDEVIDTLAKVAETGKADAEAYDLLGRAYAAAGQGQQAVESFQKAETIAPNDVGVQTRLASVRMGLGDPDAAMGDLEHTLQLAPKLPAVGEALFFAALATGDVGKADEALARIRAAQGQTEVVGNLEGLMKLAQLDFAGAKASFTELAGKYPDFTPARINLARVDGMLGERQAADMLLTNLLAKQPAAEPALTMVVAGDVQANKLAQAAEVLEKAHHSAPGQTRITVTLGDVYIRAGTAQKALDLAAAETSANAASVDILSMRVAAYLALGLKKDAEQALMDILKQDSKVAGARRKLVALLIESGDFETARNVLTTGLAAAPHDYPLYQDCVLVDLKAKGLDAALATADRMQSQNQDFSMIGALKGDLYMAVNRPADAVTAYADANDKAPSAILATRQAGAMLRSGRADEAGKLLVDWLGKHPDDLVVMAEAAQLSIAAGKLDDAAANLQLQLKHKPHDAVALNNLAWVYQQQGKDAPAQTLARQAYLLSPGPQTADTLGWILTNTGNARSGAVLLRQASGAGASDPRILYHYAVALNDTGDRDTAKRALQAVVSNQAEFREKQLAQKLLDDLSKGS